MSTSRPLPTSPALPLLADLAELLHEGSADLPGSALITIEPGEDDVALGMWPVPDHVEHPADPLVGFLAPPSWSALGVVSSGRLVPYPAADSTAPPELDGVPLTGPVRVTSLFGRDGQEASVISQDDRVPLHLPGPVEGWVPDVVARALGLPTSPPDCSLAHWVERAWLDQLAGRLLRCPGSLRHWKQVSALHPLAPAGSPLPGVLLAVEAGALDLESSWERMRLLWQGPPAEVAIQPPGGRPIDLPHWFDDGSFCRWVQRNLPEADDLLPLVLDGVPQVVADELCEALVTVEPDVA